MHAQADKPSARSAARCGTPEASSHTRSNGRIRGGRLRAVNLDSSLPATVARVLDDRPDPLGGVCLSTSDVRRSAIACLAVVDNATGLQDVFRRESGAEATRGSASKPAFRRQVASPDTAGTIRLPAESRGHSVRTGRAHGPAATFSERRDASRNPYFGGRTCLTRAPRPKAGHPWSARARCGATLHFVAF